MFERDNKLNDDVMLNKLYNMIKASLSLNNVDNKNELLLNFEKVAKDIDKRDHNAYLEEVNEKFYKTTNLDDERKRLSGLIVLITERIVQRNSLLEDYASITGQQLLGLDEINYSNELNSYKERSNIICNYLENEEEILNIKKELEFLSNQLEKEREVKRNCEVVNAKLEEKLLNNFKNVIAGNKYYTSLSFKDIDDELRKNEKELKEKKEKVNAFVLAYESIKNESITSNDQLEEYSSYVSQMKEMYYDCTKKNAFLQIYKLVMNPKVSTEEIYHKRVSIKKLLDDLTAIKLKLKIEEPNLLFDFYMLVKEQDVKVTNSVDNMKKIKQIEDKIDYFNEKISRLEQLQENDKIVNILKEYGLITEDFYIENLPEEQFEENIIENNFIDYSNNNEIDIYSNIVNDIDGNIVNDEDNVNNVNDFNIQLPELNEVKEENVVYKNNAIKEIRDLSPTMNIGLVNKKASNVINKVSSRLGIERKQIVEPVQIVEQSTQMFDEKINGMTPNLVEKNIEEISNDVPKQIITDSFSQPSINVENIEQKNDEQPVVMPNFDFTTFWDEITVNNDNNSNNGDNMPNLPM